MDLLLSRQRHLFSALGQAHKQGGTQAGDQTPAVSTFTGWCRRVFSTVVFFNKPLPSCYLSLTTRGDAQQVALDAQTHFTVSVSE